MMKRFYFPSSLPSWSFGNFEVLWSSHKATNKPRCANQPTHSTTGAIYNIAKEFASDVKNKGKGFILLLIIIRAILHNTSLLLSRSFGISSFFFGCRFVPRWSIDAAAASAAVLLSCSFLISSGLGAGKNFEAWIAAILKVGVSGCDLSFGKALNSSRLLL